MLISVKNTSGATIVKGKVVYQTGFATPEQVPTIALASALSSSTAVVLGITDEAISNNTIGDVAITSTYSPIDTSSFLVNDLVYLSDTAGEIATTAGTIEAIIGRVLTVGISGSIFIRCQPPTSSGSGAQGATGVQGVPGGGTGSSDTLNMNALGRLKDAGALPATNLGPELTGGATTYIEFRARRGAPGTSGTTTIQLELNGSTVAGAILSWTSADAAYTLKLVSISVAVSAGDRLAFRLTSIEDGDPTNIIAEVNG